MSDYEFTPVYCVQQETVDNLNGARMRALQTAIPWLNTNNLTGFIHKRLKKFQDFSRSFSEQILVFPRTNVMPVYTHKE